MRSVLTRVIGIHYDAPIQIRYIEIEFDHDNRGFLPRKRTSNLDQLDKLVGHDAICLYESDTNMISALIEVRRDYNEIVLEGVRIVHQAAPLELTDIPDGSRANLRVLQAFGLEIQSPVPV